jgi:hypothetical protein
MLQLSAGFVEDLTEPQQNQLQMRGHRSNSAARQRGEKMVLIGLWGDDIAGYPVPLSYCFTLTSTPIPR